ncbi:MAG: Jag N-terminal domain-containing protein [Chloroflexota bacterium]
MSEYQEFTGKSVEEAIKAACDQFGVGLGDLDFEILTSGSRGVLGMGAEPARIVAAPRSALGGTAPKREAAESQPLPAPRPREDRPYGDRDRGDRGRAATPPRVWRSSEPRPAPRRPGPPPRRSPGSDRRPRPSAQLRRSRPGSPPR